MISQLYQHHLLVNLSMCLMDWIMSSPKICWFLSWIFLLIWKSILTKTNLRREDMFWLTIPCYSLSLQKVKAASPWSSWSHDIYSQEQRMNMCMLVLSSLSTLLHSSGPNSGNGASHSGLGLPTSFLVIKTISNRHTHRAISSRHSLLRIYSQVILDFVKLTC